MNFYLKMAWRNIFRNRKRTFLTGLIIGIGLASIMFTDAIVVGMKENMIQSVTSSFIGDAQIHYEGFQDSYDAKKTIENREQLLSRLQQDEAIESITERTAGFGTISSPSDINSILIYGIDPSRERPISKVDEAIRKGSYFNPQQNGGEQFGGVLIGSKLAERLEVKVGDRIVLSATNVKTDDLAQNMFRVAGIYTMQIDEMDTSAAFIPISQAQEMLGLGSRVHEIAVSFKDVQYASQHSDEFAAAYSKGGNKAETWPQLVPQMKKMLDLTDFSVGITMIIVFAVIIFGIINTLFMSLYERIFEFGVLRAVGTKAVSLRKLIVFEAASLAVYSSVIGVLLGALIIYIGSVHGMNLTGVEFAGATFTEEINTVFRLRQFILHPLLIFLFTVLVSLYPARYAGRMSITHALQKTL
ncbi:MAG TPA: ABC transporter permease [Clostridia bacterium]|nr:ABC transporter permease [Clostridia bacterium]